MLLQTVLLQNFCLDEFGKEGKRILPAEIARLGWNGVDYSFLNDIQLCPAGHLFQGYNCLHFPRQIWVVELVCVANTLVWHQFKELPAEREALAGGEVSEGHLVGAANSSINMVYLAGVTVRRKPFGHGVGINERPINSLWFGSEYPVKTDGVGGHDHF